MNALATARVDIRTSEARDDVTSARPDLEPGGKQHATDAWMRAMRARVEAVLDRALPPSTMAPARLHEAMRYATLGGGKRVRAMLVYAAADWATGWATARTRVGGDASNAAPPLEAADAAAADVELIHAYSLVHDDLPCMDDDVLRRGRPTVHVAFDEPTALLVGDALQSLAFELVATSASESARVSEHVILLAVASGSRGMAGGQAIDLESVGKQLAWTELEAMHRAKTGALLRAAVLLGVGTARTLDDALDDALDGALDAAFDDRQRAALDDFCAAIGLAFQVVDDVLDVETDSTTLGKTAGKDAMNHKPTVVTALGLSEAKALAHRLRDDADRALEVLGGNVERLRDVADFITGRSF